MALELKVALCTKSNCTELIFKELTGVYNALTNLTGYNAPNALLSSVTIATLAVKDPSGVIYNINLFPVGFPTINTSFEYSIPLSSLNRTSIEDGYWQFTYTVTIPAGGGIQGSSYSIIYNKLITCNAECCVNSQLADITKNILNPDNCDDCITTKRKDYDYSKTLLDSLKYAAMCGNTSMFTSLQTILNKICKKSGCKTCN